MITLDREHPLVELIHSIYVTDYAVQLMEQGDQVVPSYLQHPRTAPLGNRKRVDKQAAPKVFALSTVLNYGQFEIYTMQDLSRAFDRNERMLFAVCVLHPDAEPVWGLSEDVEMYGRSSAQVSHPLLDAEQLLRIEYNDETKEGAFSLRLVTKLATSVGLNQPDAFSDSLISLLTSK